MESAQQKTELFTDLQGLRILVLRVGKKVNLINNIMNQYIRLKS